MFFLIIAINLRNPSFQWVSLWKDNQTNTSYESIGLTTSKMPFKLTVTISTKFEKLKKTHRIHIQIERMSLWFWRQSSDVFGVLRMRVHEVRKRDRGRAVLGTERILINSRFRTFANGMRRESDKHKIVNLKYNVTYFFRQ